MSFKSTAELEEIRLRVYDETWALISDFENKTWKLKDGQDAETGLIYKSYHEEIGTIWKISVNCNISADEYYKRFVVNGEVVGWVPYISEYRHLDQGQMNVGWNWGVVYIKVVGFWPIANRDFVNIYFHKKFDDGSHLIVGTSVDHPRAPQNTGCVRAEVISGAVILRPIPDSPNRCEVHGIDNKDMKGYLPKTVINHIVTPRILKEFSAALIEKTTTISQTMAEKIEQE